MDEMKSVKEMMADCGIEATVRTSKRQSYTNTATLSIKKYAQGQARITLNRTALTMILGHEQDINAVLALSRDHNKIYIIACKPEELGSVLLKVNKSGTFQTGAGDLATKLGVTNTIGFTGEVKSVNRNVYEVELKKDVKSTVE